MSSGEEEEGFDHDLGSSSISTLKSTLRARQLYACAWMALLIYDWLSMLPQERKYIWKAEKTTPIKLAFLLNRYLSLLFVSIATLMILVPVSSEVCDRLWWAQPIGGMIIVFLSSIIMSIRTTAIYDRKPSIVMLLGIMLFIQAVYFAFIAAILGPHQFPEELSELVDFYGCFVEPRDEDKYEVIAGLLPIAPLFFDLVIVILTIHRSLMLKQRAGSAMPLLRKIVGSGSFYFIVISVSNLANVVLYAVTNPGPSLETFHSGPSDALTSILCCRLVLSLFDPASHTYNVSFVRKMANPNLSRIEGGSTSFKLATIGIGSSNRGGTNGTSRKARGERMVDFEGDEGGEGLDTSPPRFSSKRAMMVGSEEPHDPSNPQPFENLDSVGEGGGYVGGLRLERETVIRTQEEEV